MVAHTLFERYLLTFPKQWHMHVFIVHVGFDEVTFLRLAPEGLIALEAAASVRGDDLVRIRVDDATYDVAVSCMASYPTLRQMVCPHVDFDDLFDRCVGCSAMPDRTIVQVPVETSWSRLVSRFAQ